MLRFFGKTNYRPVAFTDITSKVFERMLLDALNIHLKTCANQFGVKKKQGVNMCIILCSEMTFNQVYFTMK